MPKTSKWVRPTQKRPKAIAYGCYLPDDEPNPLNVEADGVRAEKEAEAERRRESRLLIAGIKAASQGRAVVGKWEAKA